MNPSNLYDKRITFIGAGNMAEALVRGLLGTGSCLAQNLRVSDINEVRLSYFFETYGISGSTSNTDVVSDADVIVLAVKPQAFAGMLSELYGAIPREALIISIAAGIPAQRIEAAFSAEQKVIRIMPNTPSLIGAGVTAVAAGSYASEADLEVAEVLLRSVGIVIRVEEPDLDVVTALSGSGPAYVFYLVEALIKSAATMGLHRDVARTLVVATVEGAARLLRETGEDAAELRRRVTSKGGTTEAALNVLHEAGVAESLMKAVNAARDRSCELSRM